MLGPVCPYGKSHDVHTSTTVPLVRYRSQCSTPIVSAYRYLEMSLCFTCHARETCKRRVVFIS